MRWLLAVYPRMRKSWPKVLILAGVLLIPLGFLAISGAALEGVVLICGGFAVIVIGFVAVIVRFAVRRRLVPHFLCGFVILVLLAFSLHKHCFSLAYIRGAKERPTELWYAALKGFHGPVYYVGSDGEFSYFRAG